MQLAVNYWELTWVSERVKMIEIQIPLCKEYDRVVEWLSKSFLTLEIRVRIQVVRQSMIKFASTQLSININRETGIRLAYSWRISQTYR